MDKPAALPGGTTQSLGKYRRIIKPSEIANCPKRTDQRFKTESRQIMLRVSPGAPSREPMACKDTIAVRTWRKILI